ncbi:MAG: GtrA family protein [Alphaproteobacteria bacterium]|nr:GtrA family protein [Alphaproteobacteria bacterium]
MAPLPPLLDRALNAWHKRGAALKAMSFGAIGVVNTAIDASIFFLALATITTSLVAANVLAWLVAVSCSYVMNTFITFARESGRKLRWRDYGAFAASGIAGVVANTTVLVIAAQFMPVWAAKGCAILVSFLVNFSLSHFVVFRKRERPADDIR